MMSRSWIPGAYQLDTTPFHRVSPFIKVISLPVVTLSTFFIETSWVLAFGLICAIVSAFVAGNSPRSIAVVTIAPLPIFVLFVLGCGLSISLDNSMDFAQMIVRWEPGGLIHGLAVVTRIYIATFLALVLTSTTTQVEIMAAIQRALGVLEKQGVRTGAFSLMLSVAMRAIPDTFELYRRIYEAQANRGAFLDSDSIGRKLISYFSVVKPMFIAMFRRAEEMSSSLRSKGFDIERPVWYKSSSSKKSEYAGVLAVAILSAAAGFLF